jgi:hypothetical protein
MANAARDCARQLGFYTSYASCLGSEDVRLIGNPTSLAGLFRDTCKCTSLPAQPLWRMRLVIVLESFGFYTSYASCLGSDDVILIGNRKSRSLSIAQRTSPTTFGLGEVLQLPDALGLTSFTDASDKPMKCWTVLVGHISLSALCCFYRVQRALRMDLPSDSAVSGCLPHHHLISLPFNRS